MLTTAGAVSIAGVVAIAPEMPAAAATSGPTIYVTEGVANAVVPINSTTNAVGAPIPVGAGPRGIAITPDGATAFEASDGFSSFSAIDTKTNSAGSPVAVGDDGIAIAPDGSKAYMVGQGANSVIPIDVATQTPLAPIRLPGAAGPQFLAITPNGKTIYVPEFGAHTDTVIPISTATNAVGKPIRVGKQPMGIAITPDGKTAYVANDGDGTVTPIATATNTPGTAIPVNGAFNVAIAPDGKTAYVAAGSSITPISIATNKAGAPIRLTGTVATGIAITPDGKTAYAVSFSGSVTPISTATNKAGKAIKVGKKSFGIAITPDQAPVAALSVTPAAVGSGVATQFDASASVGPSSPIVSYRWDFGDGTTQTTSVPTASHVYASVSTYSASVTETDAAGTSIARVFTGQTMSRNGGPSSVASVSVVIVSCTTNQTCDAKVSVAKSSSTPPQTIEATGSPSAATGTLQVAVAPAALVCANVDSTVAPVVDMNDTGFAPTTTLTVKTTLHNTKRASSHQVCFKSAIPYLSQSNPTVPAAGTALLLSCVQTLNVAPCVLSTVQVGPDVVVTTLVPGGDPVLKVVAPAPARIAIPIVPTGKLKAAYSAHLQTTGGIGPIVWSIVRGKLPKGLTLNAQTGAITGKPTAKVLSTFTMKAADAESPPETAQMTVTIAIK